MTKEKHKKKNGNKNAHNSYSKPVEKPFEYYRVFEAMLLLAALGCEIYTTVSNSLFFNFANCLAMLAMFAGMIARAIPFVTIGFSIGLIGAIGTLINSMRSIWLLWEYMIDQMFASSLLLIIGTVLSIAGYILYIIMCTGKKRILVKGVIASLFCLINVSVYGFAWGSYSLTLWHLPMILGMLYMVFIVNRIAKE